MAALKKDRGTPARAGDLLRVKVKGSTKIHAGSLVFSDGGHAIPAKKATGLVALGRAEEAVDNGSGSDGDLTVLVRRGVFRWANATGAGAAGDAETGKDVYALDDQTVTKTSTGASKAGKCLGVDSEGVWVETR